MAETYEKSTDGKKLIVKEQITEERQMQYTIEEIDNVIADLQEKLNKWKAHKSHAQTLKVGEATQE